MRLIKLRPLPGRVTEIAGGKMMIGMNKREAKQFEKELKSSGPKTQLKLCSIAASKNENSAKQRTR